MDVVKNDKGMAEIIARTSALAGSGVKVGFQSGANVVDGYDALDIAIWNEYGTETIPARPFMRDSATKYEHDMGVIMVHLAKKVQDGENPDVALATLGEAYQQRVQAHIRSGEFEPNAPSTIARKGSSKPLVDKGRHLVPGVRYEVLK